MGVVKTCGSFTELRRPEMALKCFVRFVVAQAAVESGMELLTLLFSVAQDAVTTACPLCRRWSCPMRW